MDEKTLERIVKCIVAWSRGGDKTKGLEFNKNFLKIFDDVELIIEEDEEEIKLKIKI